MEEERYFTTGEVAARLNKSRRHVARLCRQGHIRATRPTGGEWLIPASEVERLLRNEQKGLPSSAREPDDEPVEYIPVPQEALPFVHDAGSGPGTWEAQRGHKGTSKADAFPHVPDVPPVPTKDIQDRHAHPGSREVTRGRGQDPHKPRGRWFPLRFSFLGDDGDR